MPDPTGWVLMPKQPRGVTRLPRATQRLEHLRAHSGPLPYFVAVMKGENKWIDVEDWETFERIVHEHPDHFAVEVVMRGAGEGNGEGEG